MKRSDIVALVLTAVFCFCVIAFADYMTHGAVLAHILPYWVYIQWSLISLGVLVLGVSITVKIWKWYMREMKETVKEAISEGIKKGLKKEEDKP